MAFTWNRAACIPVLVTLGVMAQPIVAQNELSAEEFARDPQMRAVTISPDGSRLLYVLSGEGRQAVMLYELAQNSSKALLPGSQDRFAIDRCVFKTDTRVLCSFRGTTDAVRPGPFPMPRQVVARMLAVNTDGSEQVMLMQAPSIGSQFEESVLSLLPEDAQHILVTADDNFNFFPSVFRLDVFTAKMLPETSERQPVISWLADRTGQTRFGTGFNFDRPEHIVRARDSKSWRTLGKLQAPIEPLGFGVAPDTLLVASGNNGRSAIWELDLQEQDMQLLFSHPEADVRVPLRWPDDNRIVGFSYETDRPQRMVFDQAARGVQASIDKLMPDTWNVVAGASRDGKKLVVRSFSDVQPAEYFLVDLGAGRAQRLGSEYPQLSKARPASMKSVQLPGADNISIPGYLTLPPTAQKKNFPAVVLPHGEPFGRDSWRFDPLVQMLAHRGYAVLQINFRGSAGYGQDWATAGAQGWGSVVPADIAAGAQWLVSEGIADPKRICIVGRRYSGFAALVSVARDPTLFRCVASIGGLSDVPPPSPFGAMAFGGAPAAAGAGREMAASAPVKNADRVRVPALLVHGTDDIEVPVEHSTNMERALKKHDAPVELLLVEGADHTFTREEWRKALFTGLDAFLVKHLAPPID